MNNGTLALAPASGIDVGALADIITRSFEDYFVEIRADEASLARMIRSDGIDLHASRVVMRGDDPIGVVLVALRGWSARIVAMAVAREDRGAGVGSWALKGVLQDLDERGFRAVWLEVIEQNDAGVRLYASSGFERVRRLVGYRADAAAATAIAAAAEDLLEIDPRTVGVAMTLSGNDDLPWQLSGETLSHACPPARAYRLDAAMCIVSDPSAERVALTAVVVPPAAQRRGEASRLIRAVLAAHPGREWRVAEIMPEAVGGLFGRLGFARSGLTQLQMRRGATTS
jgi:ribosomal protein S18 acetylase RimI-like enzyme